MLSTAAADSRLGHVHSHAIAPWQLIFIIVGVVTVLTAPVVWFVIDSDITTARFFDEHDKAMAIERLRANQTGAGSHEFKWAQVWEMCYDPKTILWLAISMLLNIGASVTNAFGPTLIKGFGFDASISTLLNMPFGALQFIFILAASYAAHMWHIKSAVLAIFIIPVIVGLALLYNEGLKGSRGGTYSQGPALAGYYLLSFLFGGNPLIVSWMAANTAGQTKKSSIMSLYNAGSAAGNIIGPVLFNDRDKVSRRLSPLTPAALPSWPPRRARHLCGPPRRHWPAGLCALRAQQEARGAARSARHAEKDRRHVHARQVPGIRRRRRQGSQRRDRLPEPKVCLPILIESAYVFLPCWREGCS